MIYLLETVVQKKDKVNNFIKGIPSVLIYEGELNLSEIKSNHIEMNTLQFIGMIENG